MKRIVTILPLIALSVQTAHSASLQPVTAQAWEEYVASANRRMEQRLSPGSAFLWASESPDRLTKVRGGEIAVSPAGPQNPVKVPAGLIHDWVGATFIPHASINDVVQVVRDYARFKELYRPNVIDSRVIAMGEPKDRFSIRLVNQALFVKMALDTDYESRYVPVDDRRGYSVSRTTRVQEIEEFGAPAQHFLQEGEGSGVIWRLFSVARFEERDGGVFFEIEAIALSRDVPASLRWVVDPIVRRVSRNALTTTLEQTQNAVGRSTARAR